MDKLLNLKNLNAEDYNSVDVCAYLRKSNSKTQQLKKNGEEISDILLHASRQYSRWRYYLKQKPTKTTVTAKMSESLSPADRTLLSEYYSNRRNGLTQTKEIQDAVNRYSKVCRQERKKKMEILATLVRFDEPSPVKKEKPKAAAANVSEKKMSELLSPAVRLLNNECKRNRRKGLPVTDEMRAAANLYSKVCRQEKKKQSQTSVTVRDPVVTVRDPVVTVRDPVVTIYKGLLRNGLSLIQAYDSDDDDEIFNKEWDPTTIVERLQKL